MFDGVVYGHGYAAQRDCPPLPYTLVAPSPTPANLTRLGREIARWTDQAHTLTALLAEGKLTVEVASRAQFGVDTLVSAQTFLTIGACCQVLAADPDDHVLGVLTFTPVPPDQGTIDLVAVEPINMPGSSHTRQLRGVGTALVAVASRRLSAVGAETIYLHPLDTEARRFWLARGFRPCGLGSLLCVRGDAAIAALIDGCLARPECPLDGDCLVCGRSTPPPPRGGQRSGAQEQRSGVDP